MHTLEHNLDQSIDEDPALEAMRAFVGKKLAKFAVSKHDTDLDSI